MFRKLLVANRGEIACRIIKTATQLGIKTVALYSSVDRDSLHVSMASEAMYVGEAPAVDSYLNIDTIINIALKANVDAIHPGYGFLSENPAFAKACDAANITFIGPPITAIEIMASKQLSKQLLEKTDVPLTPGYHGAEQSTETLLTEAKRLGFPVLIKASSGGGGKGMRIVSDESSFAQALAGAQREAQASFGDSTILLEKLIQNPRHIEIQIMADNYGNVVHLFERDCSLQRRHQKIIEEAPAFQLPEKLQQQLAQAAIDVSRAIDYRGAGTVEFLVSGDKFYFIEMNTRLQVEHPVTEMITNTDLVAWQIYIAANKQLPCLQDEIQPLGHAIECRIYAEDPEANFMPSTGQVELLREPSAANTRLDTGIKNHDVISQYYDPMIAKLITHGDNRHQAITRMQQALQHYQIGGIKTNINYLQALLNHPDFQQGRVSTTFLHDNPITLPKPDSYVALAMVAGFEYLKQQRHLDSLSHDTFAWQPYIGQRARNLSLSIAQAAHHIVVTPINPQHFHITYDDRQATVHATNTPTGLSIELDNQQYCAPITVHGHTYTVYLEYGPINVTHQIRENNTPAAEHGEDSLKAPMTATVVAILKNKGDTIRVGDPLMVLEAMKMEHTILAPNDGLLVDIFYDIGSQVSEGEQLLLLEHPEERAPELT